MFLKNRTSVEAGVEATTSISTLDDTSKVDFEVEISIMFNNSGTQVLLNL